MVGLRGAATRIQRRDGAASALTCPGALPSVPLSFLPQESRMSADDRIKLEPGWKEALREEFDKPYMKGLSLIHI